ncbi:MAG: hypothetical protein E7082_07075 [Bacteroidales bacterium]|nr:hypothetical protein [Bacteroidales bacterium]
MKLRHIITAAASIIAIVGCNHHGGWTLRGNAPEGTTQVYIESPTDAGSWETIDSVAPQNGEYEFRLPAAKGTIYRVSASNTVYYVPADSTETITLSANGIRQGSQQAALFNQVDSIIKSGNPTELFPILEGNFASLAAYYAALTSGNYSVLRTVAQFHSTQLPDSERTRTLLEREKREREKRLKQQREATGNSSQTQTVIYAPEISYFEIERINPKGEMKKLSDVVESNPIVVLAFSDFERPENSELTMVLNDVYTSGVAIYQVGFDRNSQLWANRAADLPWTCVFQSESDSKAPITSYMVTELPTIFLLVNSEIVERVTDYTTLKATVAKYL